MASDSSILSRIAPLSPRGNKLLVATVRFAILGVIVWQYLAVGSDVRAWDWLLISGLVIFAIAVAKVDEVRPRFERCVERLFDRGILRPGAGDQATLMTQFDQSAQRWALWGAIILAVCVGVGFGIAIAQTGRMSLIPLGLAQIILAFFAGGYLGEMAYFGRLGTAISRGDVTLHLDPWHADKAAGMKPVGDYYFFQAAFATIPAAYLAIWLLMLPFWPRYAYWEVPYMGLLAVAIVIQILAIFVPMNAFHREMISQKQQWRTRLDEKFKENFALRSAMIDAPDSDHQAAADKELETLTKQHAQVEAMPTWPIDRQLWQRFTVRNLFLISPLAIDIVVGSANWKAILSTFATISA